MGPAAAAAGVFDVETPWPLDGLAVGIAFVADGGLIVFGAMTLVAGGCDELLTDLSLLAAAALVAVLGAALVDWLLLELGRLPAAAAVLVVA